MQNKEYTPAQDRIHECNLNLTFLWYPRCSTCRRAKAWLDERNVSYNLRDIVLDHPTYTELLAWTSACPNTPLKRFCNTSGIMYRELAIKARLDAGMSEDELVCLMAEHGKLVKRPILLAQDSDGAIAFVHAGFREDVWETSLKEWHLC